MSSYLSAVVIPLVRDRESASISQYSREHSRRSLLPVVLLDHLDLGAHQAGDLEHATPLRSAPTRWIAARLAVLISLVLR